MGYIIRNPCQLGIYIVRIDIPTIEVGQAFDYVLGNINSAGTSSHYLF
jgi:hypothetical protein